MSEQINIRFYEELKDFLPQDQRKTDINHMAGNKGQETSKYF